MRAHLIENVPIETDFALLIKLGIASDFNEIFTTKKVKYFLLIAKILSRCWPWLKKLDFLKKSEHLGKNFQ